MSGDPRIAIVAGSDSDLPHLEDAVEFLEEMGIDYELQVMSAHRSPEKVSAFAEEAEGRGLEVILAAAGGAAHLAGVVAAHTRLPVIGIPISTDRMGGLDSLFSTVQMPGGVPVASVGLGSSGGENAAVFAARILALKDEDLRERLEEFYENMEDEVEQKDRRAQEWLKKQKKQGPDS